MQTAPSTIASLMAAPSNGKPAAESDDQREQAGFASSLRAAMPHETADNQPVPRQAAPAGLSGKDTLEAPAQRSRRSPAQTLITDSDNNGAVAAASTSETGDWQALSPKAAKTGALDSKRVEGDSAELERVVSQTKDEVADTDPATRSNRQTDSTQAELLSVEAGSDRPMKKGSADTGQQADSTEPLPVRAGAGDRADPSAPVLQGTVTASASGQRSARTAQHHSLSATAPRAPGDARQTGAPAADPNAPGPDSQLAGTAAMQSGARQQKTARDAREADSAGQTSAKAKPRSAPGPATSQPQAAEQFAATISGATAGRTAGNTPGATRGPAELRVSSAKRPVAGTAVSAAAASKAETTTSVRSDITVLKQTAAAGSGSPDPGPDRLGLTGITAAPRAMVTSNDPAMTPASLPEIDAPLDPANVSEAFQGQLGERLVMAVRNDMSRAEIRVTPNELGPITIELQIDGNTAAISFGADNSGTRNALQDSLPSLRDQLAREGLNLGEASVGEQPNRSSDQRQREEQSGQWTRLRGTDTDESQALNLPDGYRPPIAGRGLVDLFA